MLQNGFPGTFSSSVSVSNIFKAMGHAAGKRKERQGKGKERKNVDPSWDSNH